jgi:SAM-dependent methyltransferase/uncharacterized protein YbaR (Trm112 family)
MNLSLLQDLACPSGLTGTRCLGSLQPASVPAPRFDPGDAQEMIEGLLECRECGAAYPVLCGVAVVMPDTAAYLQQNYRAILSLAVENELTVSPAMFGHLRSLGAHYESPARAAPAEDSPRALGSYLCAHYDRAASPLGSLPAGHPLAGFAQDYLRQDLYDTLLAMFTAHLPAPRAKLLDLGCHVGRLTRDLAGLGHALVGLDISFTAIFVARRAVRGWPSPLGEYETSRDGFRREKRTLRLPPLPNAELLVASALQLPFRPACFDGALAANLIDILPDPVGLLREIRAVLREGGLAALSTPYHSGASQAAARWLGPGGQMDAAQALRWRIGHHFTILAEREQVPWVLAEHQRRFQVYLNHCLVGSKPAGADKP